MQKNNTKDVFFLHTVFHLLCNWWRQVYVRVGVAPGPAGLLAWGGPGRLPGPGALGGLALLAGPVRLGPALPAGLWACGRCWPRRRGGPVGRASRSPESRVAAAGDRAWAVAEHCASFSPQSTVGGVAVLIKLGCHTMEVSCTSHPITFIIAVTARWSSAHAHSRLHRVRIISERYAIGNR